MDDVDEEDGSPYDMYSDPEPPSLRQGEKDKTKVVQQFLSENTKLLEDALDDLSVEETSAEVPPDTKLPSETESTSQSKVSVSSNKLSPKAIGKIWPPPNENDDAHINDTNPRAKPAQPSVVGKWKPQKEWKKEVTQPPPKKMNINEWLKSVKQKDKQTDKEELLKEESLPTEEPPSIATPVSVEEEKIIIDETSTTKFVSLKPVNRDESGPSQENEEKSEFAKVQLKKIAGKQVTEIV